MTYHRETGHVEYRSKDGKETRMLHALEWLAAICSHVPNKGEQMVRYYGYYSNVSRGKRKKADADEGSLSHGQICSRYADAPFLILRRIPLTRNPETGSRPCFGLHMVPQGAPAVFFRILCKAGTYRIQVDAGQAINKGIAVIPDNALEAFCPEKAFSVVQPVVITRKRLFDLFHVFREIIPSFPQRVDLSILLIF